MGAAINQTSAPCRLRFQYRIRTLLVAVLLLSLPLAWLAERLAYKRREQAAVAALEEFRARFRYQNRLRKALGGRVATALPDFLSSGTSVLSSVDEVDFGDFVSPGTERVTDSALFYLWALPDLEELDLRVCDISDTRFDLDSYKRLLSLGPSSSLITDAGIEEVVKLKRLSSLRLGHTRVTDAGLKQLATLRELTRLDLESTPVTDAGLRAIASLDKLETLSLDDTCVTDEGLKELGSMKSLGWLSLSGTRVTDAGLQHLCGLKRLRSLYLWNTRVTERGVQRLQKALPALTIRHVDDSR